MKVVLILTSPNDPHADSVISHLQNMDVQVVRWHMGEFNQSSIVTFEKNRSAVSIQSSRRQFCGEDIISCWVRRPEPVTDFLDDYNELDKRIISQESQAFLEGLFGSLGEAVWFSHPYYLRIAGHKPYQLRVAGSVGFLVPDYIISNESSKLHDFAAKHQQVVFKPISSHNTGFAHQGYWISILVKNYKPDDLASLVKNKPPSPCFLQQYIHKEFDARVTVVNHEVISIAIKPKSESTDNVDWRANLPQYDHIPIECPEGIKQSIIAYQKHMKLNFGAFDFAVDRDGRWWFLECNQNGQWLWLELETGLPISKIMAESLALVRRPLITETPLLPA